MIVITLTSAGPYRIVYIDGTTGIYVAASDICYIFPKPSVPITLSRRPESKVVLHPQFRKLTENAEDFKIPVPSYFNLNFQLNNKAIQIALQVDPLLGKIRLDLVPTYIEDDEFWKNYFYRMVLLDTNSPSYFSQQEGQKDYKLSLVSSSHPSSSSSSAKSSGVKLPASTSNLDISSTIEKLTGGTTVVAEMEYTEL